MTKAFLWILLIISLLFLALGLMSGSAKPAVLLFWGVIGAVAAFKLFAPKR